MVSGFNQPTFEESSLEHMCQMFYQNYRLADDPNALKMAQRDLDAIVIRCQHDRSYPSPFEFFKRKQMIGPMRYDAQVALRFVDAVMREIEGRKMRVLGA